MEINSRSQTVKLIKICPWFACALFSTCLVEYVRSGWLHHFNLVRDSQQDAPVPGWKTAVVNHQIVPFAPAVLAKEVTSLLAWGSG